MSTVVDEFIGERPVLPGVVAVEGIVGIDQSHELFKEDAAFILLRISDPDDIEAVIPIYISIDAMPGMATQIQEMHDLYTQENAK